MNKFFRAVSLSGFLIATALAFPSLAAAAIQCYECHGSPADYRPVDAAYRNVTTGGFKGSHRTHMAPSASPATCAPCHGAGAATYNASHRGGTIDMAANINSSPKAGGGTYSRGTSFAQSTAPTPGTCSSVNCHFESLTPAWSASPFTSPTDCNRCHGAAPADGSHPAAAGSGKKHGDYYGLTTTSCARCHPDHTAEAAPFAHATSSGKRGLLVRFNAAPNSGAGAYNGTVSYPAYLPSQNPPRNGSCTATYCHSPGNKASAFDAPNTAATWGGSLTCKGCHKADIPSGSPLTSGSHQGHVNGMGVGYTQIKCLKCHAATVNAGMTIVNMANHVDKQVTVAFHNTSSAAAGSFNGQLATPASPSVKAAGAAPGQCTNVYCHSSGQGDGGTWPPTYQSPTWGTASTGRCGTCHNIETKHDAGGFAIGTANPLTTGSHSEHLRFKMGFTSGEKCSACHAYTLTGFNPTACSSTVCHNSMVLKHSNYEINVGMPDYYGASATYNAASLTPGTGYSSCSNVYCHSDGKATPTTYATPTWGNAASGACGTCHGVTAASTPASTPHAKHMGSGNPYRFACAECHSGKVQVTANSTTAPAFTNLTSHVDKVRNVKFDPSNPFGTYSTASLSCRNLYCHSTGNTSVAAGNLPGAYGGKVYARLTWSGNTTCASCHGRSTVNGMPDYANAGTPGSATSNSHAKHVTSNAIACRECHEKTTLTSNSIRTTVSPSYHVNSTANVFFNLSGNSAAGSYDAGQKKCSTTYCHGAGASLAWGGTTYCNSCHSASAASSGGGGINSWGAGTPVSAHKLHWEDASALPSKYTNYSTGNLGSAGTYRFACASCHNPASGTHVNGYASGSYRAQVFFGYTAPGKKPTYTYTGAAGTADNGFAWSNGNTTCTATYCHSNGAGGAGNTAVSWASTANSATNTRCKACHSYTTASGALIATNKHAKHADGTTYAFNCAKCHTLTTTNGTTIADKTKHVNKAKNVAWDSLNSDGSAYVNSSTACANIYCHSQGTTFAQPYTGAGKAPNTAVTWGGGQTLGCNGCHGNANGYTTGTYRVATPLYASGSPKGNAHASHVDARLGTDAGAQCLHCHSGTTTTNTSITTYANHVNEAYNVAAGGTYRDGNNTTTTVAVTVSYAYNAAGSTCSNVSCHPVGLGKANKTDTVVGWKSGYQCSDCHNIDLQASDTYHHAMRNYSTSAIGGYPTAIPDGQATTGTNSTSRRCTMCHVDHNVFSPVINANAALTAPRAMNLRTAIGTQPSVSTGYTNRDFIPGGTASSPGICVSCHATERTKSTVYKKDQASSNVTPAITYANYSASAHQYVLQTTVTNGGASFNANCTKCHNTKSGETVTFQNSANKVAVHKGNIARMQAPLGIASPNEFEEEDLCYRCHSLSTDSNPGGAAAKSVANKDYYGARTMNAKSQAIYAVMQKGSPVTTSTNTLFLRNTASAEPAPNATGSTDAFQGGTWQGREMLTTQGATANTQSVTINNTGNPLYWRMTSFVSPPVSGSTTINAGNWTLRLWALENNAGANAYMRATIYVWTAADAKGTVILAPTNYSTELTTLSTAYTWTVAGGAATLNSGDRIVVELEIASLGAAATTYTATYRWNGTGTTDDSKVTMPQAIDFTTGTTGGASHMVGAYSGTHLPSSTDETRAYLSANKHVECLDCHNVHTATATNATKGASGVDPTNSASNWTAATGYTNVTVNGGDDEYKICFKCHSAYNTSVTSWKTGWVDISKEFSTANASYHWVEGDKGAAKADTTYGNFNTTYVYKMMPRYNAYTDAQLRVVKMRCSDCHGSDNAENNPNGPHGSAYAKILKVPAGSAYTVWNSASKLGDTNVWCFNCHSATFTNTGYSSGGNNYHTTKHTGYQCMDCHIKVPHGWQIPHLLKPYNMPANYPADNARYNGTGGTGGIDLPLGSAGWNKSGAWAESGCGSHQNCN